MSGGFPDNWKLINTIDPSVYSLALHRECVARRDVGIGGGRGKLPKGNKRGKQQIGGGEGRRRMVMKWDGEPGSVVLGQMPQLQ